MPKKFYLQATKVPGLQFEIVELNKETMRAKLKGATGVPFEQSITPDNLKKFGYDIKVVEVSNATPVHSEQD